MGGIKRIVKNNPNRKERRLLIVGTEGGKNTEQLYFRGLERTQSKYHIIFASGNDTDARSIVENTANTAKKEGIDRRFGDKAFSVFDLDLDKQKVGIFKAACEIAVSNKIEVLTSNPTFELWLLLHFEYSTRQYSTAKELERNLKRYLPKYTKTSIQFDELFPRRFEAIANAIKLIEFQEQNGTEQIEAYNNPITYVHKLAELLCGEPER